MRRPKTSTGLWKIQPKGCNAKKTNKHCEVFCVLVYIFLGRLVYGKIGIKLVLEHYFENSYRKEKKIEREIVEANVVYIFRVIKYRGADKSLARPGRKQATAAENFDFHISYL